MAAALTVCAATEAQVPAPSGRALQEIGEYRVSQWTSAEGLPQNTVTDMLQLPNGELWVATFGGLARFDGLAFHVVDVAVDEGLPSNRIVALAPAGPNAFWFLSQHGHLGKMEGGRARALAPPPYSGPDTLDLVAADDGRVLCRPADGSVWVDDGAGAWRPLVSGDSGPPTHHQLVATEDGEIWAIRGGRPIRVPTGEFVKASASDAGRYHYAFPRRGGGLWLTPDRGLVEMHGGRIEHVAVNPPLAQQVTFVRQVDEHTMWIASPGVVAHLTREPDGSWIQHPVPIAAPAMSWVRSMLVDDRGSLWVGTNGGGLYRVSRPTARRFASESGLAAALSLAPDGQGGAYVARECRGLAHVSSSGTFSYVPLIVDPSGQDIGTKACAISLAAGEAGLWARADNVLLEIGWKDRHVRRVTADLPRETGPVLAGPSGSVWVVSRRGTVQLFDPGGRAISQMELPPPLMSASVGPGGDLWVGGDGKVFRASRTAFTAFGPAEGVPRGLVRDVVAEPDGTVWIGTYGGGVGRLRRGHVTRLTNENGLPDNSVSRILNDGRGRMWILTNRGLAVVERRELDAAADGLVPEMAPVVLGPNRGVVEANFGSPAGFIGGDGRLWYATIEGVGVVDTAGFPFNAVPPVVGVDGVWADGQRLPLTEEVGIRPMTAHVHLALAVFELRYPESVTFRYRVENVDAGWHNLGTQRFVEWAPPAPGRYRVLVEARNEDGVWSATPAVVTLHVLPAWWQTTAVRGLSLLGVLVAGLALYRWRVRSIERRHEEQLRGIEEQRQATERISALRTQLEHVSRVALAGELAASLAHEVSQPLGAIVNNAEAGSRNLDKYLRRPDELGAIFGAIVADGMRASEVVNGLRRYLRPRDVQAERVDLSSVVREALPLLGRELRDHRAIVELSLDGGLPPVAAGRVQLEQIVLNLVMNACEALDRVDGDRRITLTTASRNGRVELSVRDNGPGMAEAIAVRAFEPFATTKPDGLGMGLAICRGIAEAHGGSLLMKRPPGGGLEIVLSLPAASGETGAP